MSEDVREGLAKQQLLLDAHRKISLVRVLHDVAKLELRVRKAILDGAPLSTVEGRLRLGFLVAPVFLLLGAGFIIV